MVDLNFTGPSFTWCNNQSGLTRMWARLDWCLVNLVWTNLFKTNILKHLNRSFSDHSLIFLSSSHFPPHKNNIFRIEKFWLDYLGCHDAVRNAWELIPHGNPLQDFAHLLSRTHFNLSHWRRLGVNRIKSSLLDTKANICHLEASDLSLSSQSLLSTQYAKLAAL